MTTYYKATRPDGTDFYSGTVLYKPGKRVRPAPAVKRQICGAGFLHASDVPGETLVIGQWPCRLFEVSGKPAVGFDSKGHLHKGGFKQLTVVREIEAWQALGPNGREAVALIEQINGQQYFKIKALIGRMKGQLPVDSPTLRPKWIKFEPRAGSMMRSAAINAAWDTARLNARSAAMHAAMNAIWEASGIAVWDAIGGLIVRDLLTVEHFEALYGPWRTAVVTYGD